MKTFIAYTDGACSGNPGPGGWGAQVTDERGVVSDLWGFEAQTTNNRMEMLALLRVLQAVPSDSSITVYSDSNLLVKGINEWCAGWEARGWRKADGSPVVNADLWKEIVKAKRKVKYLKVIWVKGHSTNEGNIKADLLATSAIKSKNENLALKA